MAKNINLGIFAVAAGTVDAITATYTPAPPSLYNGLVLFFRASGATTVFAPTFKPNTLDAKPIVKKGNAALVAGDIVGDHAIVYNSTLQKWILLNPASDASDSIWEENSGIVTLQELLNVLRLGSGDTNFGASPLEIYSEAGISPFFIGDLGTTNWLWLNNTADGLFEFVIGNSFHFNSGNVYFDQFSGNARIIQHDANGLVISSNALPSDTTATTATAGDNSTKVATTAYVDRVNIQSVASAATVTAVAANDLVVITAQAEALTLANPTGTWQQGQALAIRIKDNGTSRAIAYGAKFRALGTTLPTVTTISKTVYLFVIYNSTDDTFDVTGVSQQA